MNSNYELSVVHIKINPWDFSERFGVCAVWGVEVPSWGFIC